jgi:hypothetical protein
MTLKFLENGLWNQYDQSIVRTKLKASDHSDFSEQQWNVYNKFCFKHFKTIFYWSLQSIQDRR